MAAPTGEPAPPDIVHGAYPPPAALTEEPQAVAAEPAGGRLALQAEGGCLRGENLAALLDYATSRPTAEVPAPKPTHARISAKSPAFAQAVMRRDGGRRETR